MTDILFTAFGLFIILIILAVVLAITATPFTLAKACIIGAVAFWIIIIKVIK